ncbi:MAG TPA: hypothetical protein VGB76_09005 [Pyrinomonadaceae bacterium]|jgi:hypothetical protein
MFNTRKIFSTFAAFVLIAASALAFAPASVAAAGNADNKAKNVRRVSAPLDLAILVQDDLVRRVGHELDVTREFVRELPSGSRVMVGYLTRGKLQVRQDFTTDLEKAGRALRAPVGSELAAPFNPYVVVLEALRRFETDSKNRSAVLLISDGLDASRGLDPSSTLNSIDLARAIDEAKRRHVAVYSFYAPTVGLTSFSRQAVSYGQGALNRFSNETGGRAFFQGTDFVSFSPYFERLSRTLNSESGTGF